MQRCGFCSLLSGVLRRAMCIGSRRGSSESYYRELGDQDTLKIEDKSSDLSDDAEEETSLCRGGHETPRVSPRPSPRASPRTSPRPSRRTSPRTSPLPSRRASPRTSPRPTRRASPQTSPRPARRASPRTSPQPTRRSSPQTSPKPARRASPRTSPQQSRQSSPRTSPLPARRASPQTSPRLTRRASTLTSPRPSRQASPRTSPRPSRQASPRTSPRPARRASPQTSPRPARRASTRTSPRPSRKASPRTSSQPSQSASSRTSPPRPSRRTSSTKTSLTTAGSSRTKPKTSSKTAPRTSSKPAAKTSPQPSRRIPPKTPRRPSQGSSPDICIQQLPVPLPNVYWKYSRVSWLYFISSDIQSDSMEENDPEHYQMRERKSAYRFLTMHKRRKKRLLTRSLCIEQALLDDLMLGQVQCILNQSVEWKFNAFTLETVSGGRCLPVLCVHLFQSYGLLSHFHLDAAKAWKLFSLIEEGYHSSNPYHNSIHAADVTQAMHCFLQQDRIRDHMTPVEIMASLLAAIAHDMDHPGVNQPFLIATSNHLATLYQNTSVLENHHWRSAMSCLIESGILDQLSLPGLRDKLEAQISSLILATDITRQQEYLTNFKNHLDNGTLDMTKSEHRHLVLQIALKCADISNPCRPWEISRKWSLKVCEEFFRQGDYERRLNLPVTALCDRHSTTIPKIQTGFFKYVVTPLITEWHRFLQTDLSSQMLYNLSCNQQKWETLVCEEQEAETEISDADLETDNESNKSDSVKLLLPPRRSSLNPIKKKGSFKEPLRRFSVPLSIFQDRKLRSQDKIASNSSEKRAYRPGSSASSQPSLHSQLSLRGHCSKQTDENLVNSDTLLPDSTIASITTPAQATRLNTVLKEGGTKLVRQPTFPPLESTSREPATVSHQQHVSNEDVASVSWFRPDLTRAVPGTSKNTLLFVRDSKKTDSEDTSDTSVELNDTTRNVRKENSGRKSSRREASAVGSQLRDNLTSMPLELDSDPLLQRRRKSMPADVLPFAPREKKIREVPTVMPQFLRRTFSSKESWTKRRGSAPSPVAPSELRGLASLGSPRHSVNGARRKPSLTVTCQQWLAKATYGGQERTLQQFPRRSSLPVEVYKCANSAEDT